MENEVFMIMYKISKILIGKADYENRLFFIYNKKKHFLL